MRPNQSLSRDRLATPLAIIFTNFQYISTLSALACHLKGYFHKFEQFCTITTSVDLKDCPNRIFFSITQLPMILLCWLCEKESNSHETLVLFKSKQTCHTRDREICTHVGLVFWCAISNYCSPSSIVTLHCNLQP